MLRRSADLSPRYAFHVPVEKYVIHKPLGEGAYGVVCSATHRSSGQKVAIKKIVPFQHHSMCLRTLRELRLLRHFDHDNIVSILDVVEPISYSTFSEVYLVQELMPTDLEQVIRVQELSDGHCQFFIYQVLRGLKAIHSAGVLHRDLKPANLLVNVECDLKICDFGLARAGGDGTEGKAFMTEYVATRWYRAPEIMLTFKQYTQAIDVWSAGCILAEMLGRKTLFPGRNYHHQLALIFGVLGSPSNEDFQAIKSHRARSYIRSMPQEKKKPWRRFFPKASSVALDLLERLLTFNPQRRISVGDALQHPYVSIYHDPDDEPISKPVTDDLLWFDKLDDPPEKDTLKRLIFDDIMGGPALQRNQVQQRMTASPFCYNKQEPPI